jgi:hypothetical protein
VGYRQGRHFLRRTFHKKKYFSPKREIIPATEPPFRHVASHIKSILCVGITGLTKVDDRAKLALEISVIGALMRKADDAIQEPKERHHPSVRTQNKAALFLSSVGRG